MSSHCKCNSHNQSNQTVFTRWWCTLYNMQKVRFKGKSKIYRSKCHEYRSSRTETYKTRFCVQKRPLQIIGCWIVFVVPTDSMQQAQRTRGPDTCQRKKGRRTDRPTDGRTHALPAFCSSSSATCGARADEKQVCCSGRKRTMDRTVSSTGQKGVLRYHPQGYPLKVVEGRIWEPSSNITSSLLIRMLDFELI